MPTYTVFTAQGKLTVAQKEELARVITDVYFEEFGLARYMTQVIFDEIATGDRYIAGKPVRFCHGGSPPAGLAESAGR